MPKFKIFMAEDDPALVEVFGNIIKEAGHELQLVSDGAEAMEYLKANSVRYDIALIDYNMPQVTGDKVIEYMGRSNFENFDQVYLFTNMIESDPRLKDFMEFTEGRSKPKYLYKSPSDLKALLGIKKKPEEDE